MARACGSYADLGIPLSGIAGLGTDVIPHTLRNTRATWLMQAGIEPWEAAGHLGMSLEMLQRVYGNTRQIFRNGRRKFEYLRRFCAKDARKWSEWQDLNLRPPRPERGVLSRLI
jgi:hypothetical protein